VYDPAENISRAFFLDMNAIVFSSIDQMTPMMDEEIFQCGNYI